MAGLSDPVFAVTRTLLNDEHFFGLMVLHAWRKREELELDEVEHYLTVSSMRALRFTVLVALLSWPGLSSSSRGQSTASKAFRRDYGIQRLLAKA